MMNLAIRAKIKHQVLEIYRATALYPVYSLDTWLACPQTWSGRCAVQNLLPVIRVEPLISNLSFLCGKMVDLLSGALANQLGCVHTNRVESSPIRSSQTLESRGVHTDRVESNQVCASSSGFLELFEQRASKELYSDGDHACFARDYVEKGVAS